MINTVKSKESKGMISIEFFSSHIFNSYEKLYDYLRTLPYSNNELAKTCIHYLYKANCNTYSDVQHINTVLRTSCWSICIGIYDIDSFNENNMIKPFFCRAMTQNGKSMIIMKFSLPYIKSKPNEYKVVTISSSELEIKLNQFNEQGYQVVSITNNGRDIDFYNVVLFKKLNIYIEEQL